MVFITHNLNLNLLGSDNCGSNVSLSSHGYTQFNFVTEAHEVLVIININGPFFGSTV